MALKKEAPIRTAAERAAAEVYEAVRTAAYEAARDAVVAALRDAVGLEVGDVALEDRVTRTEAARQLGVTPQTIIRLERKGAVDSERTEDGRVYVSLGQVRDALGRGRNVSAQARIRRGAS